MTEAIKFGKKAFTWSVVAMTVLWSMGVAALVPTTVHAADCPTLTAGQLFKVEGNSAVYLVNAAGKRMYFPNGEVYKTWFEDFSGVTEIAPDCVASYPNDADQPGVNFRPGSRLVKVMIDPRVYYVGEDNMRHWIADGTVAEELFGANWGTLVRDVHDFHWANYTDGADITESTLQNGMLVQVEGAEQVWYVMDGKLHQVDGSLPAPAAGDVRTVSQAVADSLSAADSSVTGAAVVEDPAQGAGMESGETPVEGGSDETPSVSAGNVMVSLAADTASVGPYPSAGTSLQYLKFHVEAKDGDIEVDSLTFKRSGVGFPSDFQKAYLYEGDERLTSGRTINSSSNEVVFNNLNLDISEGRTRTFWLAVDSAVSKSGSHAFEVTSITLEGGEAMALSGVKGNTLGLSSFTIDNVGEVLVETGSNPSNAKVGEQGAELTSFTISASQQDSSLKRVSLYHAGGVSRGHLTNLKLYKNSISDANMVAETSGLTSEDLAVFVLDGEGLSMEKGQNVKFYVTGDISGDAKAGSAETVKFYIDETADLYVVGESTGFGMGVDIGAQSHAADDGSGTYDGTASSFTTMYLEGSDVTVSTNGPAAQNVAAGTNAADDVNLLNFSVAVSEESEIRTMRIELHRAGTGNVDFDTSDSTVTSNYITDVKIWDTDTNTVVWGPVDISSFSNIGADLGVYYSFSDVESISGSRNFKVTADIKNSSIGIQNDDYIYAVLGSTASGDTYTFSSTAIKSVGNNTYLTSVIPSSYTQGANMTLKTPSLAITRESNPTSDDIVRGEQGLTAAKLLFDTTGSGSDVKVTSVQLSGYVDGYSNTVALTKDQTGSTLTITDLVTKVRVYVEEADGTERLISEESFNTSGEADFTSMDWTIPKNSKMTLRVEVDTNQGHTDTVGTSTIDAFAVDIADISADVTAEAESTALTAAQMGTASYDNPNGANGTSGPKFAVRSAGTLTIQDSSGAVPARSLVTTGSSDEKYHQFEMFSQYESLIVTKIRVTASAFAANFASAKLVYKNAAGETVSSTSEVDSSGHADFNNLSIFVDDDGEDVELYATLNTVDAGAEVGTNPTWSVQTTSDTFEAVGATGSNTKLTTFTNSASASPAMYVVKSKPVFANAGSNGSLADGSNTLYKFTVTPSGEDKVSLKKLKFTVDLSDNSVAAGSELRAHSFRLYKGSSCGTVVNTAWFMSDVTTIATTGALLNASTANFRDDSTQSVYVYFEGTEDSAATDATDRNGELVVPKAGETYCLKANIVNSASSDSVVTKIAQEEQDTTGPSRGALADDVADLDSIFTVGATDADIIWSDYSSTTSHDANLTGGTSVDFFSGALLDGLESTSISLSRS